MTKTAMKKQIAAGDNVEFDSEHGPRTGTVAEVQSGIASVRVTDTMNGRLWAVPVVELKLARVAA